MNLMSLLLFVLAFFTASLIPAWGQKFEVLFSENIGRYPEADLMQGNDGNFYGTTTGGGASDNGTIFKLTPTGEWTTLHSFNRTSGYYPQGKLLQGSDGSLYGTNYYGGTYGEGTVFKLSPAGVLTTVHAFTGASGSKPQAGLLLGSDGNLYGITTYGGANGSGTVFRITPAGVLTTLHSFNQANGSQPRGGLVQGSDGNLYGVTSYGGANDGGTVFRITTGGVLTTLHSFNRFTRPSPDGYGPEGGLVQGSDGNLYGTTVYGGVNDGGTVFKITLAGVLSTVHSFSFADTNGYFPNVGLVQGNDGSLYGTTSSGGSGGNGAVFKITLSGTVTSLYAFSPTSSPISIPLVASRLLKGNDGNFYGATRTGGDGNVGSIFKITPAGALTVLHACTNIRGRSPAGLTRAGEGALYGTTTYGGAMASGTIFRVTPSGVLTTIHSFNRTNGSFPQAGLLLASDGSFYGTTPSGGASSGGTVFKMTAEGVVTTLHSLDTSTGTKPQAGLAQGSEGNFYGTAREGGTNGGGTVFRLTPSGDVAALYSFDGTNGSYPQAGLSLGNDGNLYGTTREGGASNYGTIFRITPSGVLTSLHSFNRTNGAYPQAGLVLGTDGNFYGTTREGGVSNFGTIFRITPAGVLTVLHSFNRTNGAYPESGLVQRSDGYFYGTTREGGVSNFGTIFRITPAGEYTAIHSFNGSTAAYPAGTLAMGSDGHLYGTAQEMVLWKMEFPSAPTVTTGAGSEITARGALLQGSVSANDAATTVTFDYGLTAAYGSSISATPSSVAGTTATDVTARPTSLQPHTLYHFRLKATNGGGTTFGADATFTTANTSPAAGDITVNATTGDTMTVALPFALTDADGDAVTIQSISASKGAPFSLGAVVGNSIPLVAFANTTGSGTITFTVSDGFGGTASGSVSVVVSDNDKPVFTAVPSNVTLEATHAAGAIVMYTPAEVSDNVGVAEVNYSHPSGSTFPIGSTVVTVTARDEANNKATASFTVTVRDTTAPAIVNMPGSMTVEATSATGAVVSYSPASATDFVGVAELTYSHPNGSTFPLGSTVVTVTARDAAGNATAADFTVTVQDTTAPSISGAFSPLRAKAGTSLPDYRSQAQTSDNVGVVAVSQSPAPGTVLTVGFQSVTLTVRDAAGNETSTSFMVNGTPLTPEGRLALAKGDAVPGAGVVPGIPSGAVWESFGVPCVTESGDVVFAAEMRIGKTKQTSLMLQPSTGESLQVLVSAGDAVPEIPGATFASFKDPLAVATLDGKTVVAFQSTIRGAQVKSTTNKVVCRFTETGGLELLGCTGGTGTPIGEDGVKVTEFISLGLAPDGALWATATLVPGIGGVTKNSNQALLVWPSVSKFARVALRKGDAVETASGEKTVSTIATLAAASGSPGHGRWMAKQALAMRVTFSDRLSAIYTLEAGNEDFIEVARQGSSVLLDGSTTPSEWASFGLPAIDGKGGITFLGSLKAGVGGVTSSDSIGLFRRDGDKWVTITRVGMQGGLVPAPTFTGFKDPVSNSQGAVAFITTERDVVIGKKSRAAVWVSTPSATGTGAGGGNSRTLKRLAKMGEPAPGAGGALFESFVSLALPDGEDAGPLLVATLAGKGVSRVSNRGLWTVDANAGLYLALRNGFPVPGLDARGPVRDFTVLGTISGSPGQPRTYNSQRVALCRIVFRDGSGALVRILLP